jgi:hypothetical protein
MIEMSSALLGTGSKTVAAARQLPWRSKRVAQPFPADSVKPYVHSPTPGTCRNVLACRT